MKHRTNKLKHEAITEAVIGSAFEVYNVLGYGFLEKVYQRALQSELLKRGYSAILELPIQVKFKNIVVGNYAADILVDDKVIVELKVAKKYNSKDEAQLLNELKASRVEFKRFIF